jgi:malonate-semialdehyde dehydrogenase (acetylating) / methylmalonate-semialdehyde dehydrogenase
VTSVKSSFATILCSKLTAATCFHPSCVVSTEMTRPESPSVARRRLSATAQHLYPTASTNSIVPSHPATHDKIQEIQNTPYFKDNEFIFSESDVFFDVHDPATNHQVTRVPQLTSNEMEALVTSAKNAFPSWSRTTILTRQQIMFRFVQLIRANWDRLAAVITLEQGKTLKDARGDVLRGLQVAEAAISAPELLKGEVLEVAKDMETRTYRSPLGVVAAICPFSQYDIAPDNPIRSSHVHKISRR